MDRVFRVDSSGICFFKSDASDRLLGPQSYVSVTCIRAAFFELSELATGSQAANDERRSWWSLLLVQVS